MGLRYLGIEGHDACNFISNGSDTERMTKQVRQNTSQGELGQEVLGTLCAALATFM